MNPNAKSIHEYKVDIVTVGKMMYERRYIIAGDGNLSIRLDEGTILATPTALCKGLLSPDQIVKLDLDGNVLDGEYTPSSEIKMHLAAYKLPIRTKFVLAETDVTIASDSAGKELTQVES